ncbi:hypothetical protein BD779DRAFT_1757844 [Infundibulicybe gibba]|nr:hypothetical protein BD779DRAFT_1757844 [Infundibulicybe gibba]
MPRLQPAQDLTTRRVRSTGSNPTTTYCPPTSPATTDQRTPTSALPPTTSGLSDNAQAPLAAPTVPGSVTETPTQSLQVVFTLPPAPQCWAVTTNPSARDHWLHASIPVPSD